MGTATNLILTRKNVNNMRKGSFLTESDNINRDNKCVIKKECSGIDLLVVDSTWPDNKCISKTQLTVNLDQIINIYYGIENNQNVSVTLDYLTVELSTSSSSVSGTWKAIGSINPSTIGSFKKKTGYVACKVSNYGTIDLGTQYYLRVRCGNTLFNQKWYWDTGDYDTSDLSSYSMANSEDNVDRITTDAYRFLPSGSSFNILTSNIKLTLNNPLPDYSIIGRSSKHAFLFSIT